MLDLVLNDLKQLSDLKHALKEKSMIRVPASGPTVKGVDIFHGDQWNISDIVANGNLFIIDKITQGDDDLDSKVLARWQEMKAQPIKRGLYHYFDPKVDAINQANWFLKNVEPLISTGDLLNLDLEVANGVALSQVREDAFTFLSYVYQKIGIRCRLYGPSYFLDSLGLDSRFLPYGLWIADYGSQPPLVPLPYRTWDFFQYSETGIDSDVFNGTVDQLMALV